MKVYLQLAFLFVGVGTMTLLAQPPGGRGGPGGGAGGPPGGGMRPPLMQALDSDQDGEISAEEIKKSSESLVTLDKNKDGKLTEDEYRPQGGRPGEGGGRPERRGPQEGEASGRPPGPPPAPNPDRMVEHAMEFDADKDGKLSKEELQKFAEDFAKHHAGPGGPPRGGVGGQNNADDGARPERPRRPE